MGAFTDLLIAVGVPAGVVLMIVVLCLSLYLIFRSMALITRMERDMIVVKQDISDLQQARHAHAIDVDNSISQLFSNDRLHDERLNTIVDKIDDVKRGQKEHFDMIIGLLKGRQ